MGTLCLVLVILQLSWSLASSVAPPSSHLCLPHQRDALLHFKTTISVDCFQDNPYPKIHVESWNKSIDCCSWEGVECDNVTGHVIGIDLSHTCLVGSLFANNSLFQLHNLQWLDLSANNLGGSLLENTSSLFHFHGLQRLNLADNGFYGTISSKFFSQLVSLTHLNLSYNGFYGLIPHQINLLSSLVSLDLSFYSFESRFDSQVFDMLARNLTKLRNLVLDTVDMSDVALTSFLNLSSSLEHLSLNGCKLHGEFPTQVFQLPNLKVLDLSVNENLTGYLPNTNWSSGLELLDLSNCGFRGSIPASFGNLTQIISVDLSGNSLEGQILAVFDLVNLTSLDLSSNNLSGVIKSDMLSKLTSLMFLDVSSNSLLSLSTSGNDVNYSFPQLAIVNFSGCSVRQFPNFFRTSNLESLDLSNNMISGGISKWEAEGWEGLRWLDLSHNFLSALEQFPGNNLGYLNLHSNLLQGPILSTCLNPQIPILKELEEFIISENKLTGNVPSSICNLSSLVLLDLSENSLSGTIPDCLENLSYLETLDLEMNNFIGKIPNSFVNNSLRRLLLNDNQLEGLVPSSLANSTSLKHLNLGNNKLTDRFPDWLASLSSLQVLILRFNRFYGSLPDSIASSNFSALRIIDLSANEFTGTLSTKLLRNLRAMKDKPREWLTSSNSYSFIYENHVNVTTKRLEMELTKTCDIFISMDLSNNQFSGEIPEDVGQLISLQMLNLSHNNFSGPIPTSFGNLVALESLDLSSNKLSGGIPSQLTNLTFLEVLNLSNNNLVGPIPYGNQFNTFDNDSYNDNLGLCGLPLSKQCVNHRGPDSPSPLVVEHEGSNIPFFWQVVMMGYGSGVVLGLSLGYIVFTTGRPWWFVRKVERDWQYNFTEMGTEKQSKEKLALHPTSCLVALEFKIELDGKIQHFNSLRMI